MILSYYSRLKFRLIVKCVLKVCNTITLMNAFLTDPLVYFCFRCSGQHLYIMLS